VSWYMMGWEGFFWGFFLGDKERGYVGNGGVGMGLGGGGGVGGGQLEEYGRIICTVILGPMIQIFLRFRKIHPMSPVVFGGFQDF